MDKNIFDDMPTPPMTPNGKPIAKMGKIQEEEENHGESFFSRNGFWIKSVLIGILLAILIALCPEHLVQDLRHPRLVYKG